VVSDGLGFYIDPALRRLDVPPVPIISNETSFDGTRATMAFPYGHPDCLVCGTCKRQRVLAHQAAGRNVAFIGDGDTDRYAAAYADIVFAKGRLVRSVARRVGRSRRGTTSVRSRRGSKPPSPRGGRTQRACRATSSGRSFAARSAGPRPD